MSIRPFSRRHFIKALGLSGGVASIPTWIHADTPKSRKPNIIVIMADDLGFGDLQCYRGNLAQTPNLNALARRGMRFFNFHANSPVDSPTRAALLTGRYPQRIGIEEDSVPGKEGIRMARLPLQETTFAKLLKDNGYKTALFGKWYLGSTIGLNPTKYGFDEFRGYVGESVDYHSHIDMDGARDWWVNTRREGEKGYVTDLITQHGIRFIEEYQQEPFCLFLAHAAPHFPYQGRKDDPYRRAGDPGPAEGIREDKQKTYREMIEALDEGVGKIAETVNRFGLEKDTFIFFCSDNGARDPGSNGNLSGRKGMLMEGGIRVPAIICWPGKVRPNIVSMDLTMTMDLFPTLAEISGSAVPAGIQLDGISLCPAILAEKALPQRTLFWRHGGKLKERAAIKGSWKLYIHPQKSYLFNLDYDVSERLNFYESRSDIVALLQKELRAWERDVDKGSRKGT